MILCHFSYTISYLCRCQHVFNKLAYAVACTRIPLKNTASQKISVFFSGFNINFLPNAYDRSNNLTIRPIIIAAAAYKQHEVKHIDCNQYKHSDRVVMNPLNQSIFQTTQK